MAACPACSKELPGEFPFCPHCAAPLTGAAREQRKTVTVLFCDVTGSTALGESTDPEALRALLARYFERMRGIVELHGGTVEKFIGDAVMAVFGVPVVHEDDSVRALRAAVEMRDAFRELGVDGRIGVNTGEIVTGTDERLVTGDSVNVAARLEQAAQPGEILVGEATLQLVGDAVEVDSVPPLRLKGKAEPVRAHRVLRVLAARERPHEGVFVGRREELGRLRELWRSVVAEQRCALATVVAPPGVGKSRLAEEFLRGLDTLAVRGRCLPYGEGITYWPVVETLKQLGPPPVNEKVDRALSAILGEDVAATSEEIAWAYRKTLEHVAREQPIVVVFDDVQWGEETFLDLVEHVALLSSGASILMLCMARPELVDRRRTWPAAMHLDPLTETEIAELIAQRVPEDLRERIVRLAGGLPLFAEEMVAMNAESTGDVVVPMTLQALLAARLDQLDLTERRVLECASVEGEIFHRGAVQALAPEEQQVTSRLAGLVRRELVRPDRAQIPGDDGFRFRHLLIRDAAYDAIAKTTRAELHERFAEWLNARDRGFVEADEVIGYHLESAYRYRAELGLLDERALEDRRGASAHLETAGRRALHRSDMKAAASLLSRALDLHDEHHSAVTLRLDLGDALAATRSLPELAVEAAEQAAAFARASGDRVGEQRAALHAVRRNWWLEVDVTSADLQAAITQAQPVFEEEGDDRGLAEVYLAIAELESHRGQQGAQLEALAAALTHARRADDTPTAREILDSMGFAHWDGPTPVREALAWLEAQSEQLHRASPKAHRAAWFAMLGRFDEARMLIGEYRAQVEDFGLGYMPGPLWYVEVHAANYAAAEQDLRDICALLEEKRETAVLSTFRGSHADSLYALGRDAEAEAALVAGEELSMADDLTNQVLFRRVRAKLLARRGEQAQAEALAREAVTIIEQTDRLNEQGEAHADLAEVLVMAGRPAEAATELEKAFELYEKKGNIVMAERTHARLAEAQAASAPTSSK